MDRDRGARSCSRYEVGGPQENSNEWTAGVSYSGVDSKVGVGVEIQLALLNAPESRGHRGVREEALIDFAPLFGVTSDAPRAKVYVLLGWEF